MTLQPTFLLKAYHERIKNITRLGIGMYLIDTRADHHVFERVWKQRV